MKKLITNTKQSRGITLVALIITIVVLLILAVVAIGAVRNSNIIGYAQNAAEGYEKGKEKEEGAIKEAEDLIEKYATGGNSGESKVTYIDNNVPLPAGFKYVTGTKDTGLVIEHETESSQFVWVPVTEEIDANGYGLGTIDFREPDVVGKVGEDRYGNSTYTFDYVESNLKIANCEDMDKDGILEAEDFKEQLSNEYNAMVASVNHYGGFYVGRYEVSKNGEKAQSKADGTNITSATAAEDSANTWYGLYKLCKTYNTDSVKSSMIWGSQYHAMTSWMGVTSASSVPGYNKSQNPGTEPLDVIKNVYDLYGSSYEWTQEARGDDMRATRGGDYNDGGTPSDRKMSTVPENAKGEIGSRLALYLDL